jgi:ubiquinone biosynthesis protein
MGLREKLYEIRRLEQIAACLFKHELHHLIDSLKIRHHLPLHKKLSLRKSQLQVVQPQILREVFEELGGAFLKLGQVISLRPDLVGIEFAKEFEKVLDSVPPENFRAVVSVIRENLKGGMRNFVEFDSNPIAAGSIAQVHRAVLADGRKVAVKVHRPDIKEKFLQDISIMENFAERLRSDPKWQFVDAVELVQEFKKYTLKELDFNHEAVNMVRFRKNFEGDDSVVIPKVYRQYSNDKVLVMELVDGIDIYKVRNRLSDQEKLHVVKTISRMVIKQIFEDGFFHADLHPGNIMYLRNRKIALLDYGIVGYIDTELKEKLFDLFSAIVNGNLIKVADSFIELNVGSQDIDREALKAGLHYTLSDFYDQPLDSLPLGEVFRNALETARRSKLRMPSNLVLLSKSLLTMDGLCRELSHSFNLVRFAKPLLQDISKRELRPKNLAEHTISAALSLKRLVINAPRYLENFNRQVSLIDSRLTKYEQLAEDYQEGMIQTAKSIFYSVFVISLMITSALLVDKGPLYNGIPIYSFLGLCATLLMLITILRTLNAEKRR